VLERTSHTFLIRIAPRAETPEAEDAKHGILVRKTLKMKRGIDEMERKAHEQAGRKGGREGGRKGGRKEKRRKGGGKEGGGGGRRRAGGLLPEEHISL
jgi:uncharacterized membrane protein YgcG